MKIKDIVMREEDEMKIKAVSGNDVTLDQGGQEIKTTTDALTPSADKPGSFTMKPADPNQMKPGASVTSAETPESMGDEESHNSHPGHKHYDDWMNSEYAPYDDDSGDENKVFRKALHFLAGREHPGNMEYHAHHMTNKFHGGGDDMDEESSVFPSRNPGTPAAADAAAQANAPAKPVQSVYPSRNTQEGHHDLISQGNHDVGGDATDSFINQVRDREFERKNRTPGSSATSPMTKVKPAKLPESDELMKWLTIAGIK